MTEKKTEAKAPASAPTDTQRINMIIELLERNGMSIPKGLK